MTDTTLVFLIKKSDGKVTDVCLALKKRGFGLGRWNGTGGKTQVGETFEECAKRETKEEIGVDLIDLQKVGEIDFFFRFRPEWNQKMHAYLSESWTGEPTESEEMKPAWHTVEDIPYTLMWPDDMFWLPKVLEGNKIKASFTFGEKDIVLEQQVDVVEGFI